MQILREKWEGGVLGRVTHPETNNRGCTVRIYVKKRMELTREGLSIPGFSRQQRRQQSKTKSDRHVLSTLSRYPP